jgi:uncharacterized protein with HEPN domain
MLKAAKKADLLSRNRQRKDLDSDELFSLGITRLLEIIGEAASRVTGKTRNQYPAIPWAQIIGMRNRLIHGYDVIDEDILWQTITKDIPSLINILKKI